MARRKVTFDEPMDRPAFKVEFVERDGRMITSEKMYRDNTKDSPIVGIAMAGEVVTIITPTEKADDMTKIRTKVTNRIGYVNSKSLL